jgi:3-dehydroquinate synthetase
MGLCAEHVALRLERLLERIGLPTKLPLAPEEIVKAMIYDKKVRKSLNNFVLTKDVGAVTVAPILDPLQALQHVD